MTNFKDLNRGTQNQEWDQC